MLGDFSCFICNALIAVSISRMYSLTREVQRSKDAVGGNEDVSEKIRGNTNNPFIENKTGSQENDNELFRIDVTGQESNNNASKYIADDDEEEEEDNTGTALNKLFQVDTLGREVDNEDLDIEYDSDDNNCVIGKTIFMCYTVTMHHTIPLTLLVIFSHSK